jgi:hypothetical protein
MRETLWTASLTLIVRRNGILGGWQRSPASDSGVCGPFLQHRQVYRIRINCWLVLRSLSLLNFHDSDTSLLMAVIRIAQPTHCSQLVTKTTRCTARHAWGCSIIDNGIRRRSYCDKSQAELVSDRCVMRRVGEPTFDVDVDVSMALLTHSEAPTTST